MRRTARMTAAAAALGLALTACGERDTGGATDDTSPTATGSPSPTTTATAPAGFKACMVSDSGGFDDKSFNQTSLKGMTDAESELGVETATVESTGDSEYADNIASLVNEGCDQITTVGFLLGDATLAAAKKNPKVDFAIVDFAYESPPKNLKGLTFNTGEPSFLAGYLAAAKSESGTVGTFGGVNIPTVTVFMTGFLKGVEHYNQETGSDVKVLGWDGKNGSFTEDFEDKAKGQQVAEQMIQQGADVVFPVAGPAGLGGLQAAQDNDVKAIWVDTDGCVSAAEYCDVLLTSVMKGMDVAVKQAIVDSASGTFSNEVYTGTLENGGVALAPYPETAGVDEELASKIDELRQQIIDGEIQTG